MTGKTTSDEFPFASGSKREASLLGVWLEIQLLAAHCIPVLGVALESLQGLRDLT